MDGKSQRKRLLKNSKLVCTWTYIIDYTLVKSAHGVMYMQMRAAKSGNHTMVKKLLVGGADVNTKQFDYVSLYRG